MIQMVSCFPRTLCDLFFNMHFNMHKFTLVPRKYLPSKWFFKVCSNHQIFIKDMFRRKLSFATLFKKFSLEDNFQKWSHSFYYINSLSIDLIPSNISTHFQLTFYFPCLGLLRKRKCNILLLFLSNVFTLRHQLMTILYFHSKWPFEFHPYDKHSKHTISNDLFRRSFLNYNSYKLNYEVFMLSWYFDLSPNSSVSLYFRAKLINLPLYLTICWRTLKFILGVNNSIDLQI
jgi:hypothetical protein